MKIKWKRNLSIVASTLLLSSISYAGMENTIKMAVGYYMPNDKSIFPLLITSKDQGANWSYAPDISSRAILPVDFTDEDSNNSLVSANCQNNFCIAVGRYKNASGIFVPLIGLSENVGTSWRYTSIKPADYAKETRWIWDPIKTICNTKTCLIAMPYINNKEEDAYLVITTQNQGLSWSHFTITNLPQGNFISSLDCSGPNCVGAGYIHKDGFEGNGFIILSKDQGQTWSLPTLHLPEQYKQPVLEAVKCKGNICVAKGFDAKIQQLLLLRSTDAGESWDVIPNQYRVTYNNANGDGQITYTDNTWAISGGSMVHEGDDWAMRPFVLVSQDNGKTWNQPSDIISKLPDELARANYTKGELINCSGNDCVLTTITMLRDTLTPALAISRDKGVTWSYTNISPLDLGYFGASLSYLSCDKNSWVVMGHYTTKQGDYKPLLLTSNDSGKSWYSPVLNVPENVLVSFNGGTNASQMRSKQTSIRIKHERLLKSANKQ